MHSAIAWFARNPVAANLLMFVLCVGGGLALLIVHQEEFPNIDPQVISIQVPYLGAAPEEVEQGVCIRVEEAIDGIEGIDKVYSTASEGLCHTMVELDLGADGVVVLNEVKSFVDGINSFPTETEKPIVSKLALTRPVVQVAISGDVNEQVLKEVGQRLRDDIVALDSVSQVALNYVRPYEISVEVSKTALRRHGITLDQVARAIGASSLDMPGGSIKTAGGEILIRSKGQAYRGQEFEDVVVLTRADGDKVTLAEIARIRDGFEEGDLSARFNGEPAAVVDVGQVGREDLLLIAEDVKNFVAKERSRLPEGLHLTVWTDSSLELIERLSVLNGTAGSGLVLVLIVLALFLRFRVAMWVALGIPIALLGCIATFPYAGINISTLTVMAFILVLGVLVDDAIVVGERVYSHEQMGKGRVQAAIEGTREVCVPVIFGVLTTVAAFLPLVLVPGRMSEFFSAIGYVAIIALGFSIVESQLILPAHLAYRKADKSSQGFGLFWNRLQGRMSDGLQRLADGQYLPALQRAIAWRYVTAAIGLGVLVLALALIFSGRVVLQFFPSIEGERVYASLEMPEGVSVTQTIQAARRMEESAQRLNAVLTQELGLQRDLVKNQLTSIGALVHRAGPGNPEEPSRSHFAEIVIELAPLDTRNNLSSKIVAQRWRALTPPIPDAVKVSFDASQFDLGEAIDYQISGPNFEELKAAAADLRAELARYGSNGVFDIADSFRAGKQEIKLSLLPEARNLGLTLSDLAGQVRNAFYGAEAQRMQRGKDDVRVMVRFPEDERKSIGDLEDMYIRTPDGNEVPFYSVANFELGQGYSAINRTDRRRVINVTADVDRSVIAPEQIMANIQRDVLPKLLARYPGISFDRVGEQEERDEGLAGLAVGAALALVIIYALLAIPLKSYIQPLVIMSVIPFGAVGAIFGHWVMGIDLVFFSALGMVALSGVVVNASLVLVDFVNRRRRAGAPVDEALVDSCSVRFRAIILTSVTTFVGLIPLMTNQTPNTMPFIPMAVSLAYGVLFATFITLFYVPVLYRIVEDIFGWDPVAQGVQTSADDLAGATAGQGAADATR